MIKGLRASCHQATMAALLLSLGTLPPPPPQPGTGPDLVSQEAPSACLSPLAKWACQALPREGAVRVTVLGYCLVSALSTCPYLRHTDPS